MFTLLFKEQEKLTAALANNVCFPVCFDMEKFRHNNKLFFIRVKTTKYE